MFKRFFRVYLLTVLVMLALSWVLGIGRFYWPLLLYGFAAVNFPFSLGYLWLEGRGTPWWHLRFGRAINDEIGQGVAFLLMIALQAALYTVVFFLYRRARRQTS